MKTTWCSWHTSSKCLRHLMFRPFPSSFSDVTIALAPTPTSFYMVTSVACILAHFCTYDITLLFCCDVISKCIERCHVLLRRHVTSRATNVFGARLGVNFSSRYHFKTGRDKVNTSSRALQRRPLEETLPRNCQRPTSLWCAPNLVSVSRVFNMCVQRVCSRVTATQRYYLSRCTPRIYHVEFP